LDSSKSSESDKINKLRGSGFAEELAQEWPPFYHQKKVSIYD
jgi:hypothetical protein